MKFDLSKIEMSRSDIKRGVRLPEFLDKELAEFIGIMIGDGHLRISAGYNLDSGQFIRSDLAIACNKGEQQYVEHILNVFFRLFNIPMSYEPDKRSQTVLLRVHSKGIIQFLNRICGIPLNRKNDVVSVPAIIKKGDNKIKCSFLRGLADTDFSVTFRYRIGKGYIYPTIKAGFKSEILVKGLEFLFEELGFKYSTCYGLIRADKRFGPTTINGIYLNGVNNFRRWINEVGFSNSKFQIKVEKWQKYGVCPPRNKEPPGVFATPTL